MLKRQGIEPIYENKWFSGTQCAIYIGDVLIDEALSIEYSVSQSKTPIYGYASQLFDKVAPGPVLVQGSLTINYIEAGYLYVVLNRYKRLEGITKTAIHWEKFLDGQQDLFANAIGGTIEDLVTGRTSPEQKDSFMRIFLELGKSNPVLFQQTVDTMEQQIWNDDSITLDNQSRRVDDNYFDDVELFVVHGNTADPSAPSTARRISGVHFLSCSQQVTPDGSPVVETYSFLARNLH